VQTIRLALLNDFLYCPPLEAQGLHPGQEESLKALRRGRCLGNEEFKQQKLWSRQRVAMVAGSKAACLARPSQSVTFDRRTYIRSFFAAVSVRGEPPRKR